MCTIDKPAWQERYADKVVSAERAVACVRHGQRVFLGSGAAEPRTLVEALAAREDLADTEIVHILTLGVAAYAQPRFSDRFRHNAYFIGPNVRNAVAEGRADYTPIFLSEIPMLFRSGRVGIDVALIGVSTPDEHGYCTYGVSTDIVKAAAESARVVIAEVNAQMPRVWGNCLIHVRDLDKLVPSDQPVLEAVQGEPDELSQRIAGHVANLVEDGATLQLGVGKIPDAILHNLEGFKDLGIHTEMFSDGILPLIEKGVITNAKKTLHRGKTVASFVMGSRKLYDFIDNNPSVEFYPTEYVNDPYIIARNDKMISINAALEVDLTGQVCADSLGIVFYNGIGGQVDFTRGAARSKGGKPIIVLPSTAANGTISRIVAQLKPGAAVTTSRADVHYVVTEHGVAYLHGKSIRERAMALIQIADPLFRPCLLNEAKTRNLVYADQIDLTPATPLYPDELERWITLRDKTKAFMRPLKLTDERLFREMFYKLSDRSVHNRFFHMIEALPHEKLQAFLRVDYDADMALVVLTDSSENAEMIGIAHYSKNPRTNIADSAYLVRDDCQGRGIGTILLNALIDAARAHGIAGFTADVLSTNLTMLRLFHKCGYTVQSELEEDGEYKVTIAFSKKRRRARARSAKSKPKN
ncbi:MAG: GNAT family N-acetyltransferase [Phycisphaerae bacterium]|nr:GNAT family N-acetyltransferase [Phycisphaerae bacterium]